MNLYNKYLKKKKSNFIINSPDRIIFQYEIFLEFVLLDHYFYVLQHDPLLNELLHGHFYIEYKANQHNYRNTFKIK